MTLMPGHRADIEGLRAFAVLAVVVNHAYPAFLPGGFCGVDIFFVISGFLIGSHLIEGVRTGNLKFTAFYGRRVRRIFPALATMLIAVWLGAGMIMTGPEFASLGRHMAAAATFSNNLLLASESGYFDAPALGKPLLHLWSLGVEEQFYLVAPWLVWLGFRREGRAVAWFARLGALSLLGTLAFADVSSAASFYFPHTRFWELAAGVGLAYFAAATAPGFRDERMPLARRECFAWLFVAAFLCTLLLLGSDRPTHRADSLGKAGIALVLLLAVIAIYLVGGGKFPSAGGRLARPASALGFGLLVASILLVSPSEWPGPQTVFPVLATLLLLALPANGLVTRLLSGKRAVAIGQISYPLYLWHWPLLVGWRLRFPDPSWYELLVPVTAAFLLAWLTKLLIEDPLRFGRFGRILVRRPTLMPISSALVLAGLVGVGTVATDGLPQRFPEGLRAMADWSEPGVYDQWGPCYHHLNNDAAFGRSCMPTKRPGVPLLLLWGDSHAGHLAPGLADMAAARHFDLGQWTVGGCPPTLTPLRGEGTACAVKRPAALKALRTHTPDVVLLSASWGMYRAMGNSQEEIVAALRESIRELESLGVKEIIVFGPGPMWTVSLPADLFRHMVRQRLDRVPGRFGQVSAELSALDAALSRESAGRDARYFSVLEALCNASGCLTAAHPERTRPDLLFWDRDHLTPTGSRLLVGKANSVLNDALDVRHLP
jgi:peptidoglycan/LPS O-acetylase OafA/YrhL